MALSITSDEADRPARELAAATGESLTEAVVAALRERLARQRDVREANMPVRVRRLQDEVAALSVLDDRRAVAGTDRRFGPQTGAPVPGRPPR